ncbi:hypothetical protein, unlikely [Trypanosoma brucei brucei TREU927]|uniref:Uncharacterized protein n=1 Tax=Trypanosoma brucei brucei (strain 927/4 GUTat10.1) TaxID=185431 RepID=Q38CP4_TRYB2|nr:hypothetical protein, unlikely [Trypanosoma brucei brucei TREU927]EAN77426.1 hypothetical protein, unlikely [Trypanosoma brucei brucei TREU927]
MHDNDPHRISLLQALNILSLFITRPQLLTMNSFHFSSDTFLYYFHHYCSYYIIIIHIHSQQSPIIIITIIIIIVSIITLSDIYKIYQIVRSLIFHILTH